MAVDKRILGLFAKWPQPGAVKTRLAAVTSVDWAAQFANACLGDTLDRLMRIDARRIVAFTPDHTRASFASVVGDRFELWAQSDGPLGKRIEGFIADCLRQGAERVVLIGTDSPTLPLDFIRSAFDQLNQADVVLGPATDGGYYLIGCAGGLPPIFANVPWSSSRVLQDTVALAEQANLRLALLPPWYDVDTQEDCQMLRGHLAAMRVAGLDPGVPRVEAMLNASSGSLQRDWSQASLPTP
jgi:rSAM/selenodomain-associated transferase 1